MSIKNIVYLLLASFFILVLGMNDAFALYDQYGYRVGCGYNSVGPVTNPANYDQCIALPEGSGTGSRCENAASSAGIVCSSWGNKPVNIGYYNSKGQVVCKFFCTGDSDRNFVIGSAPINGQCGSANGGSYSSAPTSGLCNSGTASSPYVSGSYWRWTCTGSNGGSTASCYATKTAAPINGQCGSANGGSYSSAPTSGLCNSGTASSPYVSGSYWVWTCTGSNGGSTASCYATKTASPINGQCGSANGGSYSSAPTTGLCNSGTASSPYLSGTQWRWTCTGSNGGYSIMLCY